VTACQVPETIYLDGGTVELQCRNTGTAIVRAENLGSRYGSTYPQVTCTGCATKLVVNLALSQGTSSPYRVTVEPLPPLPSQDPEPYALLWAD